MSKITLGDATKDRNACHSHVDEFIVHFENIRHCQVQTLGRLHMSLTCIHNKADVFSPIIQLNVP